MIYSSTWTDHLAHLRQVFEVLRDNSLVAKLSKCAFGLTKVSYLGHIVSCDGISVDPDKISIVRDWPIPTSVKQLRAFLGLTGYYRRFVQGYAQVASPLTDLLKKDGFLWSTAATTAFETLKQLLTTTPILQLPDFTSPFTVETDASGVAMGAVLSQSSRPLAFFSKRFSPSIMSSSTYVKEMEAIVQAVKKWRHYLLGREFTILTDHRSLKHLLSQSISTPAQQKYLQQLLGFSYVIKYRPGPQNSAADALSRYEDITLSILSSPFSAIMDNIKTAALTDLEYQKQWAATLSSPTATAFSIRGDFLAFRDRLVVPLGARYSIFSECHSSPLGGHSGVKATLARITHSFHWSGMISDVKTWVRSCLICQQIKSPTQAPAGLLQPLPTPTAIWEDLTMDFIVSLPRSHGKDVILVVVDRLTKGAHFVGLSSPITANSVAGAFATNITKLHGMPRSIVSDRDRIFTSKFWTDLFRLHDTKLYRSTAYHPQTDGQTEVVNRCLQQFLRCFVMERPTRWFDYLHLAELWYNTSYHSSIDMSPFEATFGKPPPNFLLHIPNTNDVQPDVKDLVQTHAEVLQILKFNLQKAVNRMTKMANRRRRELSFNIGDYVLLRLHKYRQSSVAKRCSNKLERKFFGPFKVIDKYGLVAYKLDLPLGSRIHNVFHISLLKPFIGDPTSVNTPTLPPDLVADEDVLLSEGEGNDATDLPSIARDRGKRMIKAPNKLNL